MQKSIIKYGLVSICLILIIGICITIYIYNKPKRDISSSKVEFSLSATQLLSEFTKDEEAANLKFLSSTYGKVIEVTGILAEINISGDTTLNILLTEPDIEEGGIYCSIQKSDILKFKESMIGNKITVKGECNGYIDITNEVLMVKCLFTN